MKLVKKETNPVIKNTKLNTYIEDVSYETGKKKDDYFPITVKLKFKNEFRKLSIKEQYYSMVDFMNYILETKVLPNCGTVDCTYSNIYATDNDNTYEMPFASSSMSLSIPPITINGEWYNEKTLPSEDNSPSTSFTTKTTNEAIYSFMKQKYDELTNNGENYDPEVHDQQIAELANKKFGITVQEAKDIYVDMEMNK
ncbi:hypothetical protein QNH20_07855 [Neobacillus sp. WH10]|uniref:hypothetical protein n=1 Tax=Neobacillus sp. WH10 TaxID=3047873 RepID=UPI0024C18F1E|nr:hypothetical protein [Neobacillus sp. WH10]WHY79033.1 hypothetical protein QNH20_07855 [Neobacillus sp. WH10]